MQKYLSLLALAALLALGGCTVFLPGVHAHIGEPDAVYLDGGGHHGGFCPPGQRMKGNC